ncbi:hypothetical protein Dimus_025685 [Dionaea muscipula]
MHRAAAPPRAARPAARPDPALRPENENIAAAEHCNPSGLLLQSDDGQFLDDFNPIGLRALVVDDNPESLEHLTSLMKAHGYIGRFDIIIMEVRVDDSFGFLATILKETDDRIPVIMMSERNDRETVAGARLGGACKFLSKPLGEQEVQVMWQHVYRKKNGLALMRRGRLSTSSSSSSTSRQDQYQPLSASSEQQQRIRKKERMRWDQKHRERFIWAVEKLGGPDQATPKDILREMNMPNVTREQVASHLQKVREEFRKKLQIINPDHQHLQETHHHHHHIHDPAAAAAANTSSSNYTAASASVTSPPPMDVTVLTPVSMMMNNNNIINPNSQPTAPATLDHQYYVMQQLQEVELPGREPMVMDVEQPTITNHEINELIDSLYMPIETQVNNVNGAPEPEPSIGILHDL